METPHILARLTRPTIITIDGPAGSGKSTAAEQLATALHVPYLNTGKMYRVVTLAMLDQNIDPGDEDALASFAAGSEFDVEIGPGWTRVFYQGRDVTNSLHDMRISNFTHRVAECTRVRMALIDRQREIGRRVGNLVTEGRDQGTSAFPDARIKFYVTATIEVRSARVYQSRIRAGDNATLEQVHANLLIRDDSDVKRTFGPLRQPADAVVIDTTTTTIPQVLERMLNAMHERGLIEYRQPAMESASR
jgi:cytidylate kinase